MLPKCYIIFLHRVVFILFKLNLTTLEIYLVMVKHSLGKTETLCELQMFKIEILKRLIVGKNIQEKD